MKQPLTRTGTFQTQNFKSLLTIHTTGKITRWSWSTFGRRSNPNLKNGAVSLRLLIRWTTWWRMVHQELFKRLKMTYIKSEVFKTSRSMKTEQIVDKEVSCFFKSRHSESLINIFLYSPWQVTRTLRTSFKCWPFAKWKRIRKTDKR